MQYTALFPSLNKIIYRLYFSAIPRRLVENLKKALHFIETKPIEKVVIFFISN